jgi:hypothetical protein
MKAEAQRIAIAEAMGANCWFRPTVIGPELVVAVVSGERNTAFWSKWRVARPEEEMGTHRLPDYLNDLNAMHEAEKVLRPDGVYGEWAKWEVYVKTLGDKLTGPDDVAHATAAQRAEAFLKTIGKWTDA